MTAVATNAEIVQHHLGSDIPLPSIVNALVLIGVTPADEPASIFWRCLENRARCKSCDSVTPIDSFGHCRDGGYCITVPLTSCSPKHPHDDEMGCGWRTDHATPDQYASVLIDDNPFVLLARA